MRFIGVGKPAFAIIGKGSRQAVLPFPVGGVRNIVRIARPIRNPPVYMHVIALYMGVGQRSVFVFHTLQQRIFLKEFFQLLLQFQRRELQQANRLLQLRRQCQML